MKNEIKFQSVRNPAEDQQNKDIELVDQDEAYQNENIEQDEYQEQININRKEYSQEDELQNIKNSFKKCFFTMIMLSIVAFVIVQFDSITLYFKDQSCNIYGIYRKEDYNNNDDKGVNLHLNIHTLYDLQAKATHNSNKKTVKYALDYNCDNMGYGGGLQLEYDLNVQIDSSSENNQKQALQFILNHPSKHKNKEIENKSKFERFKDFIRRDRPIYLEEKLRELSHFMINRPNYPVISVVLDVKGDINIDYNRVQKELDNLITKTIGKEQLFTPKQLLGEYSNLQEAISNKNWPSLSSLQGKAFFVMSGLDKNDNNRNFRQGYLDSCEGVKCVVFVDIDSRIIGYERPSPDFQWPKSLEEYLNNNKNRVFLNQEIRHILEEKYREGIISNIQLAKQKKLIVRAWTIYNKDEFLICRDLGVNYLASSMYLKDDTYWATFN